MNMKPEQIKKKYGPHPGDFEFRIGDVVYFENEPETLYVIEDMLGNWFWSSNLKNRLCSSGKNWHNPRNSRNGDLKITTQSMRDRKLNDLGI